MTGMVGMGEVRVSDDFVDLLRWVENSRLSPVASGERCNTVDGTDCNICFRYETHAQRKQRGPDLSPSEQQAFEPLRKNILY